MQEQHKPKVEGSFTLSPAEAPAKIKTQGKSLFIGVPKEEALNERRTPLTPTAVELLISRGHRVRIHSTAGDSAHFSDDQYANVGAEIVYTLEKVYEADIILTITPPTKEEWAHCKPNQTIFSALQLPTLHKEYFNSMMGSKVTAFALEYLQDDSAGYPFVRSMSEIAGNAAVLIAAENLSNFKTGKGQLLGGVAGVPPTNVVILGSGVVGEYATRAALGFGCTVKVFDNNIYKLMRLQNHIGTRIFTSILNPKILQEELTKCDVAIGAIHSGDGRTPIVVNEDMVMGMKPGSVIVDVSIDQGGCFETSEITTHEKPFFKKHGVTHYCVPNIPSRVSQTSSNVISNILVTTLDQISEYGGINRLIMGNAGFRHGLYIYKGRMTNHHISQKFDLRFTDIELLITSGM